LVINHDGSLLACFEFDGLDRYSSTKEEFDLATKIFENSVKILDERNSIWSIFEKRKSIVESNSKIPNPVANFIETEWLKDLSRRNLSKFRNFIYISFLLPAKTDSSYLNWKNTIKF
jgi:type IV secretion system protein VirB4